MTSAKGRQMKRRPCTICENPERQRLDFLCARDGNLSAIAKKFRVSYSALYRHFENHVSAEYRKAVQDSPLKDLESLQKLAAQSGASVCDNLAAIYGGLSNRWLHAFESGDDLRLSALTARLHQNLELRARISRELLPSGATFNQTNNFLLSDAGQLLRVLKDFPEARKAIVDFYSARSAPKTIEHAAAAD